MNVINDHELSTAVADLMKMAGITECAEDISPLSAGGNNRTYLVKTSTDNYVLKHYFRHKGDCRNRLEAEYEFLCYAHPVTAAVPQPLAKLTQNSMALYEYIPGESVSPGEIGRREVDAAIHLFQALNRASARQHANGIKPASESAFSVNEHLAITENRFHNLRKIEPLDELDRQAVSFINTLYQLWESYRDHVLVNTQQLGWDIDQSLNNDERCLSPSDFGFHNAIRTPQGVIRFIDFEYAGWDDPAKTIADFFLQPAIPVPMDYYNDFLSQVLPLFADSKRLEQRLRLLIPVHQFKWCCILLNVFIPTHMARRKFANPALDESMLKTEQLAKARALFADIENVLTGDRH